MSMFKSNLESSLLDFISFKNALGIEYKSAQFFLKQLDIFNYEHGNYNSLTKEIGEGWANLQANKSTTHNRSWISPVREYGRFLRSIGDNDAYILDNRYTIQRYRAEVYLMTEDEIKSFFKACDSYVTQRNSLGRAYVLPALYRFLYCCGTRCGEARKLKCKNVHLNKGYVDILHSKGHRDRRLYLSDELILYLKSYSKKIESCFPDREYFFPGEHGGICSSTALSSNFKRIWRFANLKRDGNVKSRAFDFRHHFACANIMRWSMEGKNIHAMLPYLMRYMGHSSLESTYYYIHLIPDYFPQYSVLTTPMNDLIPEVEEYEI